MIVWLDALLSPLIALWIEFKFNIPTFALRDIDLRDANDLEIFMEVRKAEAIIITKDSDFINLVTLYGSPPKIILLTCGNTSHDRLKEILSLYLNSALKLLDSGESIIEINNKNGNL